MSHEYKIDLDNAQDCILAEAIPITYVDSYGETRRLGWGTPDQFYETLCPGSEVKVMYSSSPHIIKTVFTHNNGKPAVIWDYGYDAFGWDYITSIVGYEHIKYE